MRPPGSAARPRPGGIRLARRGAETRAIAATGAGRAPGGLRRNLGRGRTPSRWRRRRALPIADRPARNRRTFPRRRSPNWPEEEQNPARWRLLVRTARWLGPRLER